MALPTLDDGNKRDKKKGGLPNFELPGIDESFEPLPVKEALYEEENDSENVEIYKEAERSTVESQLPLESTIQEESVKTETDYNPDYEEDKREEEIDKFIDKKEKRIIPFGGKKSKKERKLVISSDFDDRKNKLAKTKVIQFTLLVVIAVIFLLGLKNTFYPSHVYTDEQIRQFAAEGAGQTGFPEERGKAFVETFMDSYLTLDSSREDYSSVLGHFYGDDIVPRDENTNLNPDQKVKQHIIIGPKVYDVKLLADYSAQFKVTSFVSNLKGEEAQGESTEGRWLSFSVNVYYDIETDSLSITKDSPTIIPSYKIATPNSIPERIGLGNGTINQDMEPVLTPTINGFLEAYSKASADDYEPLVQYITDKNDSSLTNGFAGAVELDGSPNEAISRVIYDGDDGIYRAEVTVNWREKAGISGSGEYLQYTAKYIMYINEISEGKYAVSSFIPYTYYK